MIIDYTLGISDADAHLIDMQMHVSDPDPEGQVLQLPNWIPGSYMIRDFSRNIVSIKAQSDGIDVRLAKRDKSTWQAPAGLSQLTLTYQVYAWDLSVRAAHVDRTHAFFNGTSVFLTAQGNEDATHRVTLQRPLHDVDQRFEVATTLPSVDVNEAGFGIYEASNYDELIDHPVEIGGFKRLFFTVADVPHEIVFTGSCHFDEQRVINDLIRICEHEIRFFDSPVPYERYVFLVMVVDTGYGGLEHRSSTALMVSRDSLPVTGDADIKDAYLNFLGLCSHEYFHNWNVKRIKPARFVPYELQAESYTELLWFFEGMTSYYDDLVLVRSGLITKERYLGVLSKNLTRVQRGLGRLTQSVTDSSFDAWHKFYKQDENAPNAIVSYYVKGALIALCLDSLMRQHSNNAMSLDSVMQTLWQQWQTDPRGIGEQEPQALVESLLGKEVFAEHLAGFFDEALYGTEDLPLVPALAHFGVDLKWMPRLSSDDTGGTRKSDNDESNVASDKAPVVWLGANVVDAPGGVRLTHVMKASPAQRAGLSAGDLLIALDGYSLDKRELDKLLTRLADKKNVPIHYFRLGQLNEGRLSIEPALADTAVLSVLDDDKLHDWLSVDQVSV